jgi:fatty-acyl-CoA synthase
VTPAASDSPTPSVADLLLARAGDDHPGLRFEDEQWSWREVLAESAARGALLGTIAHTAHTDTDTDAPAHTDTVDHTGTARSTDDRDRVHVGILLPNVPEYIFWLGAVALTGAVAVGINPTRRGAALAGDILRTDCDVIVTDTEGAALLDGLELGPTLAPGTDWFLDVDGGQYADRLAAHRGTDPGSLASASQPTSDDLFLLLFTSGTTGTPKAVRCTQGRLSSIAVTAAGAYGFEREDVAYCTMPLFHGNALMVLWGPSVAVGATVALARRFTASGFLDDVRRHRATTFTYVGKALAYVLATPSRPDDASSTLRRGFGTEASIADHAAFERRFGCVLTEGYGSSEGGVAISRTPETPTGSLGRPVEDVAIVDPDTLAECPPAEFDGAGRLTNGDVAIGEIVNRSGIGRFEGYYADDDATGARVRNGWYWTGDLAYRDGDGYFYFAGRRGDWMRVDSENLSAGPIERVLVRFEDAAAVAVYSVPDPRSGDQVMAAFEMLPDRRFDPEGFARFLAAQPDLGTKWSPSFVRITTGLPQTASGKVTKEPLRAQGWWAPGQAGAPGAAGVAGAAGAPAEAVYRRRGNDGAYVLLDDGDRRELRDEFHRHGRQGLVGG